MFGCRKDYFKSVQLHIIKLVFFIFLRIVCNFHKILIILMNFRPKNYTKNTLYELNMFYEKYNI